MAEECNVVVPVLVADECKGCFTDSGCINMDIDLTYLDLLSEDSLKSAFIKTLEKIENLENRIQILEGNVQM